MLNGLGVLLATAYNVKTPDLYANNAHHTMGWIVKWVMTAQIIMSSLFVHTGRSRRSVRPCPERAAFLPLSTANMTQQGLDRYAHCRWSRDSGQGTEWSSLRFSRDLSPTEPHQPRDDLDKPEAEVDEGGDKPPMPAPLAPTRVSRSFIDKYLSVRLPGLLKTLEIVYELVDRVILLLGFITLVAGGVTYSGIFVRNLVQGP